MSLIRSRISCVTLGMLLVTSTAPLHAQRVAPSAVQRLDAMLVARVAAEAAVPRERSHRDGAVHGAVVGAGAGAVTGIVLYLAASALASTQDTKVITDEDARLFFFYITGAGAVAGSAIGAIIGGIVGR